MRVERGTKLVFVGTVTIIGAIYYVNFVADSLNIRETCVYSVVCLVNFNDHAFSLTPV